MIEFFKFLKTKAFFMHAGLALVSIVVILFLLTKWLGSYTNHGDYVEVPDFKGQSITALNAFVKDKSIAFQIIDSIYNPKEKAGVVIRQEPTAKSKVKHNRIIYLYVTGVLPPSVIMPKLIDRSERQARLIIESYGLKLGKVRTRNADCNGCVLSQSVGGKEIETGKTLRKGAIVDLVIGEKNTYFTPDVADSSGASNKPNVEENEDPK
jgi:eukaryotic-like serine/threonine-protein kinase